MIEDHGPASAAPALRTALTLTDLGADGRPWPEYLGGRAAVVVPRSPQWPVLDADGWSADPQALAPGWSAVIDGNELTVRRAGGEVWLTCTLCLAREWRRAAHVHGVALLLTGPFDAIPGYRTAAAAGALRLLAVPLSFSGETW